MLSQVANQNRIAAMSEEDISAVYSLEQTAKKLPQLDAETYHVIHGGMYARSIKMPAGSVLTGALVKIATMLIIHGDLMVYVGGKSVRLTGYSILAASAHRKQVFMAISDVVMTMIFPSLAQTILQAEDQFTDEGDQLFSRRNKNHILITGE